MMDYREFRPSGSSVAVKLAWTLDTGGGPEDEFTHVATPDGCIEIIRRISGRSAWGGEQPECFAAGLLTEPAELRLGGGSRFVGLRVWPWAWNAYGDMPCPLFLDRWIPLDGISLPARAGEMLSFLPPDLLDAETVAIAEAILAARTVEELVERSGRPGRWLQRWFEREIGVPPRTYLRLLRFQQSFAGLPEAGTLADHAAAHGFSDQAHMARDFKALAGTPASLARRRGRPPFL